MLIIYITLAKQPLQYYPVERIWSIGLHVVLGAVIFELFSTVLSDFERSNYFFVC